MRLLLIALVTVVAAVILAVQNASGVTVELFFWQMEAPLAVLIALSFAAGAFVSWLISMLRLRRMRSRERLLMAQLADVEAAAGPATGQTDDLARPTTSSSSYTEIAPARSRTGAEHTNY